MDREKNGIVVQFDNKAVKMDPEELQKLCFQNLRGFCQSSGSKGWLECLPGDSFCAPTVNTSISQHKREKDQP